VRARSAQAPAAASVAGALFFLVAPVLGAAVTSCAGEAAPDPRVLVLGSDTVVLPDSIGLLTVEVGRREDGVHRFEPASATAAPGHIVRFASLDNGSHAIAFDAPALSEEARAFLERTGQLRSPPLMLEGAVWVVNLQDAPPGDYPFTCATHGEHGRITLAASR
jgi:plastocyanin